MIRKMLLVAGMALAVGMSGHSSADSPRAAGKEAKSARFAHVVIFHLKKDAPAGEAKALVDDAHTLLAKVPTVRELRIGTPADKATPKYAKKDYQVGLVVFFDDADGLHSY